MIKHQHPSNNGVLGAPAGWNQKTLPCDALPITRTTFGGVPAIASYWKPTAEELIQLNNGACVVLYVIGQTHPPVALEVYA